MEKKHVVVLGNGGHAKVITEILTQMQEFVIEGYVSHTGSPGNIRGLQPGLGDDSVLRSLLTQGIKYAFVALGDNRRRSQLYTELFNLGYTLVNAISPYAYIATDVVIGTGIAVMPGAVINPGATIRDGAIVNTGAIVDHDCYLGEFSHLAPGCALAGGVTVGTGSFLGVGTKVIDRRSIGNWAVLGAGAVVVRDIPENVLALGVPARVKKSLLTYDDLMGAKE